MANRKAVDTMTEPTNAQKEAARQARNAYLRAWRRKNPDKVKAMHEKYWIKRAEKGSFTAIQNDMLEALMCSELSGRQIKVILAIIRQTIGYQRDSTPLSLLDISKLTGITKGNISEILKQLEALHIVTITAATGRTPQVVTMEQDVSKWLNI